jgi:hypothetical protein
MRRRDYANLFDEMHAMADTIDRIDKILRRFRLLKVRMGDNKNDQTKFDRPFTEAMPSGNIVFVRLARGTAPHDFHDLQARYIIAGIESEAAKTHCSLYPQVLVL